MKPSNRAIIKRDNSNSRALKSRWIKFEFERGKKQKIKKIKVRTIIFFGNKNNAIWLVSNTNDQTLGQTSAPQKIRSDDFSFDESQGIDIVTCNMWLQITFLVKHQSHLWSFNLIIPLTSRVKLDHSNNDRINYISHAFLVTDYRIESQMLETIPCKVFCVTSMNIL